MLKTTELMPWMRTRVPTTALRGFEFPFETMRDVDRLLDELWRVPATPAATRADPRYGVMVPRIDMTEDEKEVRLYAELPGLDEKDVEVLVGENTVTIKGEKKTEHEEEGKGYAFRERTFGTFYREIPLDADVVADKVEARFENGLLTVTLPKTMETQAKYKKIPVLAGHGAKKIEKVERKVA